MNEKPVNIIIPCRNSGDSLAMTLNSIIKCFEHPYKILLIESESTDGTAEYCNMMANTYPEKIEVHHIQAEGTTLAINYGIRCAGDSDVLLTQDDVIFHNFLGRDLLFDMVEVSKNADCGIVTVKNGGGVSGEMYLKDFKWIGTWCMFIPRKTITKIGMLDEVLNPGDGDDIDYTMNVYKNNLQVYELDLFVEHHRRFNINQHEHESQKIKKRNATYFRKKWGLDKPKVIVNISINNITRTFDRFTLLDGGYQIDKIGYVHHDKEVFDMITRVAKTMNDDDIMIDVGAGVGDTSLWLEKGTCFAFEPSGRQYAHLLTNMKLNPNNNVVPIMNAVYSRQIHYKIVEGEHYGLDEIKEIDIEKNPTVGLPKAIVLDEMFKDVPNIRLIKIDAEGADFEVLKGAIGIIEKHKPVVIVEIDHVEKKKVEKILLDLDYSLVKSAGVNCIGVAKK